MFPLYLILSSVSHSLPICIIIIDFPTYGLSKIFGTVCELYLFVSVRSLCLRARSRLCGSIWGILLTLTLLILRILRWSSLSGTWKKEGQCMSVCITIFMKALALTGPYVFPLGTANFWAACAHQTKHSPPKCNILHQTSVYLTKPKHQNSPPSSKILQTSFSLKHQMYFIKHQHTSPNITTIH